MQSSSRQPVFHFDHHDPDFRARKWRIYNELRQQCPVAWSPAHGGFWVVANYDDVVKVARDDQTYSSAREVVIPPTGVGRIIPLNSDPPHLERYRRALGPFFTRPYVESLVPELRSYVNLCIDGFIEAGSCDIVAELANPVPSMATLRILGIPVELWRDYTQPVQTHSYTVADRRDVTRRGIEWVHKEMRRFAAERAAEPRDDLITHLVRLEAAGEIDADERHDLIMMTIFGGLETTTAAFAYAVLYLARHSEQRAALVANTAGIERAVEEILRWEPPVQGFARTVTRDVEIGGCPISKGDTVFMLWASANRDPRMFDASDEVRLDRFPNPHLTFGQGAHRCIGATLARVEMRIMLEELLRRIPDFEVDEQQIVYPETIAVVNAIVSLPMTFPAGVREARSAAGAA